MRGGIIDIGSYTFHALVADADAYGLRRTLFEKKTFARTATELDALVSRTLDKRPGDVRVIATTGESFIDDVCGRHGLEVERPTGEERAALAWLGISAELSGSHGELAIIDLGGSSLELATGHEGFEDATSVPLGVLALRGLTPAEVRRQILHHAAAGLATLRAQTLDTIALASGTVRALVKLGRRLGIISDLQRHVGTRTFAELARRLSPLDAAALAKLGVPASRRATLANGAVVIATVLELLGSPVVYIAASALREGALVDLARRRRSMPMLLASGMR
jgi:exopolyphosphatase / guanosine-5'-triphosphate,3'-diphosphate pyrophosphatase